MDIFDLKITRFICLIAILADIPIAIDRFRHIDNILGFIGLNIIVIVTLWWSNKEIRNIKSNKQLVKILDHILKKMKDQNVDNIKDLK